MKKPLIALMLLLSLIFLVRSGGELSPTPAIALAVASTPLPLPPTVLQTQPELGVEQPLDAPIQLKFDQPMARASVEKAFAIEPGASVDGTFEWLDDQTVRFSLKAGWQRNQRYKVRVVETAKSVAGVTLARPFEFRFSTAGFLEVTTVQPANEAEEIAADTGVVVVFNRPVVALSEIGTAGSLPDPLTFTPPVKGQGSWLNTSIYQFTPDAPGFAPSTEYTGRVAKGLTDSLGQAVLADDYEWQFTTVFPAIVGNLPSDEQLYVSATSAVTIAFNQQMDKASVEQNFSLNEVEGKPITGTFTWLNQPLELPRKPEDNYYDYMYDEDAGPESVGVQMMVFTPDAPLTLGTRYKITLPKGLSGAADPTAKSRDDFESQFTVIPLPDITRYNPANGDKKVEIWQEVQLYFNAPMNPASLVIGQNVLFSPNISASQVYTYWSNENTELSLGFPKNASTPYTVTVLPKGIVSRDNDPLRDGTTVKWQTRADDAAAYFQTPNFVALYNGYTDTLIYMSVRNVSQVDLQLYRLDEADFIKLNEDWSYRDSYSPNKKEALATWTMPTTPTLNNTSVYRINLGQKTKQERLPPGMYYVEASFPIKAVYPEATGGDYYHTRQQQILVVSQYNLTLKNSGTEAMAWLTDLQTGQPVKDIPVSFMAKPYDEEQIDLGSRQTDVDGVALVKHKKSVDGYDTHYAFAGQSATSAEFAVTSNNWDEGISRWQFNNVSVQDYASKYNAQIYTERKIYRPGQTVYFKGILRGDDDSLYSLPTHVMTVGVQIFDGQSKELFKGELPLSDMGTLHGEFALDANASLGFYTIQIAYEGESVFTDQITYEEQTFSTDFQVAEYRKPEYVVEVKTDKPEYVQGDKVKVAANAQFYSGGPVSKANVKWTLLTDDFYFRYMGQGFYDFTDYDFSRSNSGNYYSGGGYSIAEGDGVTDNEGNFTFEVDADIADKLASQTFTLDVNIEDINHQTVASQARATIHKAEVYVGLRPENYIGKVAQTNTVNIITVNWDSEPVADQAVQVVFAQHNWYSAQKQYEDGSFYWDSWVEDVPVFTTTANTDVKGVAQAEFAPKEGGIYKVIATTLDRKENEARSSTYMWISGNEYVNWRQENNDRLDLVTDQRQYKVGDVAKILIPHPYNRPVQALLTLERGHIYSHTVITLPTNSEQIEIPITEEMIPNMYLSVVVIDGASPIAYMDEKTNQPVGLPSLKVGYASLPINNADKQLNITLTPNKTDTYQPQEQVSYTVAVTNSQGKPVEAELSLALVDKAVLALAPETPGQLLQNFWQTRGLGVKTAGGLTLAIDRINLAASPQAKGGGGGIETSFGDIRGDFRETAFWLADLKTDKTGRGSIKATLPDNLTTWTMTAKGVTGADTKVGEASVDIVSTKPILVRPILPRFLVVGDEARLGMIIQNNTKEDLSFDTTFEAKGAEVKPINPNSGLIKVEAGQRVKVEYMVTVPKLPTEEKISFTMGARAGEFKDALALDVPAYQTSTPETVATAGMLDASGQQAESIVLPQKFDPTQGDLTVNIDHSLAAGMRDGLDYLEHYRYECTEQTVSRFLPNVLTYRAYKELKVENPELAKKLPELVSLGLQRLYGQQHADGGWGWWVLDKSRPNLTAYVLLSLLEAQRADFSVDQAVIDNAVSYLQASLIAPSPSTETWKLNEQAFSLYVLAEAEAGDLARNKTLFKQRDRMGLFAQAYLAMAYELTSPKNKDTDTLINGLTDKAIVSATGAHWEEELVDYYAMNTDTRSTAIVIAALARIQPDHPLLPNAVRWLMTIRENGGHWETTQETAWSLIGLTDWLMVTGELEGNYTWQVSLNGKALNNGQVDKTNVGETTTLMTGIKDLLADEANRLVFSRDEGDKGRLYYAAYLTYYKSVEEVKALDRGVIVSRQYFTTDDTKATNEAQVGDTITVKLTIIAPNDLHYVKIEDPIPAGTEAIDTTLATTSVANDDSELDRTDRQSPWGPDYGRWYFSHTELRDDRSVLFAPYLPKGTYEYTYKVRASITGEFRVRPTHAEEMYFPEVFGRGDGGVFTVTE